MYYVNPGYGCVCVPEWRQDGQRKVPSQRVRGEGKFINTLLPYIYISMYISAVS